jgi:selenocysteine lyase/cysteine desulfurase
VAARAVFHGRRLLRSALRPRRADRRELDVSALELILDWTPARIQQYCVTLTAEPLQRIAALGYQVEQPEGRAAHLFGIRMPAQVDLARLNEQLQQHRVFASLRGSALRVSPNVYNQPADFDALVHVLEQALP